MSVSVQYRAAAALMTFLALVACGGGGGDGGGDGSGGAGSGANQFWLEPTTTTTIAVGQSINIHAAFEATNAEAYPRYVDPAQITWSSSQPGFATVTASGVAAGLSEGVAMITAQYQAHSTQLSLRVSGAMQRRTLLVPGQGARSYSVYAPTFDRDIGPFPALLALHGGGGSAMIQAATTTLNEFASTRKFYVVYLEGSGAIQTFNAGACCGSARAQNVDDVAYVNAVLDDLAANHDVNIAKIFATGFSNGGMMSHRLACSIADRIAGIAAVGGASGQFDAARNEYYTCNPARPIPVLQIHATNDRNYPFTGGFGDGLSNTNFLGVDATISDWIARNNVTSTAVIENVTATTTCYRYATPANVNDASAPVVLCKLDPPDVYDAATEIVFGGGHSWPGGVRSPAASSDTPLTEFEANAYLWGFFNP